MFESKYFKNQAGYENYIAAIAHCKMTLTPTLWSTIRGAILAL